MIVPIEESRNTVQKENTINIYITKNYTIHPCKLI